MRQQPALAIETATVPRECAIRSSMTRWQGTTMGTGNDIPKSHLRALGFHIAAMDMRAQLELAVALRRAGTLIALDPQEDYIRGNEEQFGQLLQKVDVFLPSAVEVRQLVGHTNYERAARGLAAMGPEIIAIKLGAEGVIVYEHSGTLQAHVAAYPVTVVDDTGAGDAFCGGFMAGLVCGLPVVKAALQGTVDAS